MPDEPPAPSGPAPDVESGGADAERPAPAGRPPRRRAADNADSPRELAAALNERERYARRRRGEGKGTGDEGDSASEIPSPAGGPPRNHHDSAESAERHHATAPGTGSAHAGGSDAIDSAAAIESAPDAGAPAESARDARPSAAISAVGGDTVEFAVVNAVQALPFRERARARLGRAELLLFSVGHELFATPLSAVEEAVELAEIRPIPEMSASMLGVTELRGRMIPIYSPSRSLGVDLGAAPAAALIVHTGERRIALAVDDVEDVLELDLAELRDAPGIEDSDGVLVGVARRGSSLVAVVDGESLVVACLTDQVPETA